MFFSSHVAYQIKGNETYDKIHANIMLLHTQLTNGVGSKGQNSFFVAYQIEGNEAYNSMLVNSLPYHTLSIPGVKTFFFLQVVMLHIKLKRIKHVGNCCRILTWLHTPWLLGLY